HRGSLADLDSLQRGAAGADGVIHTAFNHDFSRFKENCETDRRVIAALGSAVAGSERRLIITSGTGLLTPGRGRLGTEADAPSADSTTIPRIASEEAGPPAPAPRDALPTQRVGGVARRGRSPRRARVGRAPSALGPWRR